MEASTVKHGLPGMTEDNPAPFRKLIPLICEYEDLEEDIKENLKDKDIAYNYRVFPLGPIQYPVVVRTERHSEDRNCFLCDYTQIMSVGIVVYYNIFDLFDTLWHQIRVKNGPSYDYVLSAEVRKKLPTLVTLFNNAGINEENPHSKLPFITFIDEEKKYPLLCACFFNEDIEKEGAMDYIHLSLFKVLSRLKEEVESAGLLSQTKRKLFLSALRIASMASRLSSL